MKHYNSKQGDKIRSTLKEIQTTSDEKSTKSDNTPDDKPAHTENLEYETIDSDSEIGESNCLQKMKKKNARKKISNTATLTRKCDILGESMNLVNDLTTKKFEKFELNAVEFESKTKQRFHEQDNRMNKLESRINSMHEQIMTLQRELPTKNTTPFSYVYLCTWIDSWAAQCTPTLCSGGIPL